MRYTIVSFNICAALIAAVGFPETLLALAVAAPTAAALPAARENSAAPNLSALSASQCERDSSATNLIYCAVPPTAVLGATYKTWKFSNAEHAAEDLRKKFVNYGLKAEPAERIAARLAEVVRSGVGKRVQIFIAAASAVDVIYTYERDSHTNSEPIYSAIFRRGSFVARGPAPAEKKPSFRSRWLKWEIMGGVGALLVLIYGLLRGRIFN